MANQRIKTAIAIGRARAKVKAINADFLTSPVWNRPNQEVSATRRRSYRHARAPDLSRLVGHAAGPVEPYRGDCRDCEPAAGLSAGVLPAQPGRPAISGLDGTRQNALA